MTMTLVRFQIFIEMYTPLSERGKAFAWLKYVYKKPPLFPRFIFNSGYINLNHCKLYKRA